MKKFLREFREFAIKGNVIDLAVGVIIGGAFQSVISSLVADIFSPIIGLFAKKDFSSWEINVLDVSIKYGSFLTAFVNFLIMAFVVFLIIRGINRLSAIGRKEEIKEPDTKTCPYCQSTISIKATRCPHCTSELEQ